MYTNIIKINQNINFKHQNLLKKLVFNTKFLEELLKSRMFINDGTYIVFSSL